MNDNQLPSEPLLNIPPVTLGLMAFLVLIHVGLDFASQVVRYETFVMFGFVPAHYGDPLVPAWQLVLTPLTYAFLHGSWAHIAVNGAMLAAFGAGVERRIGGARMLILFVLCSISAAFFHYLLDSGSLNPVIGASGGISGLFAAALLRQGGDQRLGARTAAIFAVIWIVMAAIFGMIGAPDGSPVAWLAHIGGFLGGFMFLRPVEKLPIGP